MTTLEFIPTKNAALSPGMALRIEETNSKYLRLTHVFDRCVYAMWVGKPSNARYAKRPKRILLSELNKLAAQPGSTWGRLTLPSALTLPPPDESERSKELDAAWNMIEPLIKDFETEANLSHYRFSFLIRERANALESSFITLLRLTLRYYYFGGTRHALLPLPAGAMPGQGYVFVETDDPGISRQPNRRGRQPILASDKGKNDFIVLEDDINDMVACMKTLLRKGPTYFTTAQVEYLAGAFRQRHPDIHTKYIGGEIVEPVTVRQFSYYIKANAKFSDELAKNLRTHERNQGSVGSVLASGPGEVYEIDATGGRLYLVSEDDPPIQLGKPTIYILIDRWSRFVPSVYISLRHASYEEVRHALLVAFTSREKRFRALGVDIDDERWVVGRIPAVLCPDRGSDFMSEAMTQAVVNDLKIEMTPLPPYCPDGKAIVERFIREVKRRMATKGMKGVYADKIKDPQSKRVARKAEAAAVHSLAEAYRMLVEIVVDHNNRPHSALKRKRVLTQAGVPPIPSKAYLWGLEHITGLRSPPFTDDDYRKLMLSIDTASISNGILRYRNRPYQPVNEAAVDIAAKSTGRAKSIEVRLDKTYPHEIFIANSRSEWASFRITPGGARELAGLSLDEEDALASQNALLWARAEHDNKVERVNAKSTKKKPTAKRSVTAVKVGKVEQIKAQQKETAKMKRKLVGGSMDIEPVSESSPPAESWEQIEEQERLANIELARKLRRKS